jgi:hypothetical protein
MSQNSDNQNRVFNLQEVKGRLQNTIEKLEAACKAIRNTGYEDNRIMPIYAEYWVANELINQGHELEIKNRSSFDILLTKNNLRIEVKSGKYDGDSASASFGKGTQITGNKFDYCIFVTYDLDLTLREAMIFSRIDLIELPKKARLIARYPKTNGCILLRYNSYEEYQKNIYDFDMPQIEIDLHKHPEKYVNNWAKIQP